MTARLKFKPKSEFVKIMLERGFYNNSTSIEVLDERMSNGMITGYIGFDATAKSLHVGSLTQIMMLYWLQNCGHRPIILMGGGTTKIGDPSFRQDERKLLSNEQIETNISSIKNAFSGYINFETGRNRALLLNNAEWLDKLNYIEMLREYGSQFTISRMLSFESVKQRLDREQSLSFLEFNYMILQAIDFLELKRRHECILQMGGSDQWGNIVNGIELTRRLDRSEVFGLTSNLLTTSEGIKMGKTQSGAIWINKDYINSFDFWQYWRNTNDSDVLKFLKLFTTIDIKECERLGNLSGKELNEAKIVLATEVTRLAHGTIEAENAKKTALDIFKTNAGEEISSLPRYDITPEKNLKNVPLFKILVMVEFCKSNKEAKRLIYEKGARINDELITEVDFELDIETLKKTIKVSAGKKRHALFSIKN